MEEKINALVVRAVDYNENDKILTLLSAERGKITAGIKGVKKSGAKLKFAAQPFCFAEYVLARRGEKYTVINCSECESFYDLRTDINKFYAASSAVEATAALTMEGDNGSELFYPLLKALRDMCVSNECEVLITYLMEALKISGYGISADNCIVCGNSLTAEDKLRFDFDRGAFTCYDCGKGLGASRATYNVLKKASGKPYLPEFITPDGRKRALRLIREYFSYKLGCQFKSLSEYVRMV